MKKLSKLALRDPLSREEMRKIKGKGYGLCYIYCNSGTVYTTPYGEARNIARFCGGNTDGYFGGDCQ